MTEKMLKSIFDCTKGHCHFCGDPLIFEKRGMQRDRDENGAWEVDHVIQKDKGGSKAAENCLPACVRCNRLRWHRKGEDLREIMFLGIIAKDEIKKDSSTGRKVQELKERRLKNNSNRLMRRKHDSN